MNRAAHLRIAAIQQGPNEADPRRNVDALLRSIDEAAAGGADVVVATELSTTPYFCGAAEPVYSVLSPLGESTVKMIDMKKIVPSTMNDHSPRMGTLVMTITMIRMIAQSTP